MLGAVLSGPKTGEKKEGSQRAQLGDRARSMGEGRIGGQRESFQMWWKLCAFGGTHSLREKKLEPLDWSIRLPNQSMLCSGCSAAGVFFPIQFNTRSCTHIRAHNHTRKHKEVAVVGGAVSARATVAATTVELETDQVNGRRQGIMVVSSGEASGGAWLVVVDKAMKNFHVECAEKKLPRQLCQ